jgi:hypothetical protein
MAQPSELAHRIPAAALAQFRVVFIASPVKICPVEYFACDLNRIEFNMGLR